MPGSAAGRPRGWRRGCFEEVDFLELATGGRAREAGERSSTTERLLTVMVTDWLSVAEICMLAVPMDCCDIGGTKIAEIE